MCFVSWSSFFLYFILLCYCYKCFSPSSTVESLNSVFFLSEDNNVYFFFFLFQIFFSVSYSCTLLTMQLSFDRSCTLFFFINSALTLRYFLIHSTILFQVFFCSFYIIKIFPLGAFCPLFEFHPSLEARIPNLRFSNALPRFLLTIRKIK